LTSLSKVSATALLLTSACSATNVRDHLVGVHCSTVHFSYGLRIEQIQSSAICIDQPCTVVATPYHLQLFAGRATLKVASGHTRQVLSLARESDTNKSDVSAGKKTLSYNIANDLSFIYTTKPVPHKSGVPYSYKFHVGQKVTVAGYYKHGFEAREAHIIGANTPLIMGQAQLNENLIVDISLKFGASGSAVLDEQGNLLGMIILSGALKLPSGDLKSSIALPVRTIAKALMKLDPVLGASIFSDMPDEEPATLQTFPVVYQERDLPEDTSPVIPELAAVPSDVPNSVHKLRTQSKATATRMTNFITKQCLVQGTNIALCHEVSLVDGEQTFREIDKSGKLRKPTDSFPIQKHGVWTQSDWTDTLSKIADNPWVFRGSVGDRYLFTFESTAEDDRCYYEEYYRGIPLFGGAHPDWKGSVACFEQVLTDKDFNVLSVFTEMHPPDDCLTRLLQTAIYYDWVKLDGLKSPVMLPVRERVAATVLGQKDLWYTSVSWTDYRKFRAGHRIKF
jgi:hypothetical protein